MGGLKSNRKRVFFQREGERQGDISSIFGGKLNKQGKHVGSDSKAPAVVSQFPREAGKGDTSLIFCACSGLGESRIQEPAGERSLPEYGQGKAEG